MPGKKKRDDSTAYRVNMSAAGRSVRQALIYFVLGCVWIFVSDKFMGDIAIEQNSMLLVSTLKGVGFVLVTAVIFFLLMYSAMKKILKSNSDIAYLAYNDELTGLYNRKYIEQVLHGIDREENLPLSVIIGDFNGLRLVNDAFGHTFGNALLKLSAEAIRGACREGDIISRWGSDEFLILLPATDGKTAAELAKRIKDACSACEHQSVKVDMTFGWCTEARVIGKAYEVINEAENMMYDYKIVDSKSMHSQTIKTIMNTLHEKNPREAAHSNRVGQLCRLLSEAVGMNSIDSSMMSMIGYLHDIGKIAIGDDILNKEERLTDTEFASIRQHPEIGCRILLSAYGVSDITQGVLGHHERWDGQGYPKGLKGEEIPLISRIITIADSFDAMTSERPYKRKMSAAEAVEEIKKHAGKQFDPGLAQIFIEKVIQINEAS